MTETARTGPSGPSWVEVLVSVGLWLSCLSTFTLAVCLYLFLSVLVSPRSLNPLARIGCRVILASAGQRLRVSGPFPSLEEGPYIYVFNHTSLLDTFVMIAALPEFVGAVGKREQFEMPLWGWLIRRWGAVPIDRGQLKEAIESLDEVERAVQAGRSLLIAPEGTRSPDGELGVFRKGPFHVAMNTGATIVPIVVRGAYAAKSKGSWLFRPGVISARVLELVSIPEAERGEVGALRDEVRQRFEREADSVTPSCDSIASVDG
jgi:1-acyl-sn-glycerol-3-phosphate acyltransferase